MQLLRFGLVACLAACADTASPVSRGSTGSQDNPERDQCLAQCELAAGSCSEKPLESFGDLTAGRAEYQGRCNSHVGFGYEAECEQGTIVLQSGNGHTSEARYYDPQSGKFLGLSTMTDVINPPCQGKGYWPAAVPCAAPTISKVLCGLGFTPGD